MDSAVLTMKMTLGILDWEAGLWISTSVLSNVKNHRALYVFLASLFIGFGQGIGVVFATITDEMRKSGSTTVSSKKNIATLLLTSTLSGATWYYLSAIDYVPELENFSKNTVNALVSDVCTFLTITSIFSLMNPRDSYRSFRFCAHHLFSSSPTEIRNTGLHPPMSQEIFSQTRVFV